jgi:AcrR family transcriptional regulator
MGLRKGEATRQTILKKAVSLASRVGLEGLSIGTLASQLALSKSGLFAHFQSKESLQIQVLDAASQVFADTVIRPAVKEERGEKRLRAVLENWLSWTRHKANPGGCIFIAAAAELDDRPGSVRDHLVKIQRLWLETRIRLGKSAQEAGFFKKDADIELFAHELHGIMLAYHHAARLLKDPGAEDKARRAFEHLIDLYRVAN